MDDWELVAPVALVVPACLGSFLASVGTAAPQRCVIRHPLTGKFVVVTPLAMQTRPSAGVWVCVEWYDVVMAGVREHKTMWVPARPAGDGTQEHGATDPAFTCLCDATTDTSRV